jgi:hypothetical protein
MNYYQHRYLAYLCNNNLCAASKQIGTIYNGETRKVSQKEVLDQSTSFFLYPETIALTIS